MATVTTQERTNILKLVAGMFNAAPGATYLNEFTNAFVDLNKDLGALANALGQTGAFQSLYPSFLSAEEFANKFLDTLGLKANTEAQDWVKAKVTAGESYASVIFQALVAIDASTAAEFKAAKDQLTNKAAVAEYYSVDQNKSATDLAALQAVVAKVTNDAATVEAAKTGAAATAGKEFSLTTATGEVVVGTAGNDTFKAVLSTAASDSTLNIGDTIDGGAGTDTLNLTFAVASTVVPGGAEIKNVEVINLNVTAAAAGTAFLNSSLYTGVQQLWQVNTGTAATNFTNVTVAADVAAGFRGNGKVGTDAASAAVTVNGASATQKTLSIALDGVGSGTTLTEGTGVTETINISGSVAKATAATAGLLGLNAGADALTVNGAFTSDVNIGAAISGAKIKTIDLSKSTGGVEINVSALTTLETIKGGAGADKVSISMNAAGTNNGNLTTIDLGAGNDTLTFAAATSGANKALSVTLGAGKDTIVATAVANVQDLADLTKGLVTVEDFKVGEDTIDLGTAGAGTTGAVLTAAQLDTAKGAASLKAAIDSVAAVIGASKSAVFSYGSDAYVFINDATAGFAAGDGLIKLVGVDAALLSTDQNGGLVL